MRRDVEAVVFPVSATAPTAYDLKLVTSLLRGLRPDLKIALAPEDASAVAATEALLAETTLEPNIDAVLAGPDLTTAVRELLSDHGRVELWIAGISGGAADAASALLRERASRVYLSGGGAAMEYASLSRLQASLTDDVSADPSTKIPVRGIGAPAPPAAGFFDAKALCPLLVIGGLSAPRGRVRLDLSAAGPFREARVENLATGARRDFPLEARDRALDLDASRGDLLVRFVSARPPSEEVKTSVTVGARRALTADEIVAKERAWKAVQDQMFQTYSADLVTSLRFRIAEVNETFDLTIGGPLFKERGRPFDWVWREFFVNGIRWKSKTLPKIPILQPEKVTTLPLEIELTEDYEYSLAGTDFVDGRSAYEIDFVPRPSIGDKPIYKGRAWIDTRTFALLKRRSVQMNLRGETLSNVETEFFRPVPSRPEIVLPLRIKGEEVFSTAGRTTAIERSVELRHVRIDPSDFEARRREAYASERQIVRDTIGGLKYLVPDPEHPGERIVEAYVSKKNLFGLAGFFYDGSLSYPIPLLGVQYFDFDLWKKGKQISIFFGGALLTANFTDPQFLGTKFDVGADLFAVAIPFGDSSFRNGREVEGEKLKHVPALFQVNVGYPLGPYLKSTASAFVKYDGYQRDSETAGRFVTPADTETFGGEFRLTANWEGFNGTLDYSLFHRKDWPFWGIPGDSEYDPSQRDYTKIAASLSKDYYFSGFRKIHAKLSYLGGTDLDRFSRYEFGAFSGNPIRGFNSGSLRSGRAWLLNLSYGLNIEDIIRLEALYDQAIVNDRVSGFDHQYFSGAGISGQLNGPWTNSLIRFDVGVPVVSHGVHGIQLSALLLKLF
jgi:hypothetical protein